MPRTTPDLVKGIVETDPNIVLDPFIAVANAVVNEQCAPTITDTVQLELIERYLAAHFYCQRDLKTQVERAGDTMANYQGKTEMYLSSTYYGQTACLLDTSKNLTLLNKQLIPRKPKVFFVGGRHRHHHHVDTD